MIGSDKLRIDSGRHDDAAIVGENSGLTPGHLASTLVGAEVAALGQAARAALVREIGAALQRFRVPGGLAIPLGTLITLARKPGHRGTAARS